MKRIDATNPRASVAAWILRYLEGAPGIDPRARPDAILEVTVTGNRTVEFMVEAKSHIRSGEAQTVIDRLRRTYGTSDRPPLVATRRLSPELRKLFRDAGISWIERDTGVCHLVAPGLLVHVELEDLAEPPSTRRRPARLVGLSGVIAETILLRFQEDHIRVSDLAEASRASLGLTSRVLQELERDELLVSRGAGPRKKRQLVNPAGLLDRWAEQEVAPEQTTQLFVWAQTVPALYDKLSGLQQEEFGWAVAGVGAANLHVPTLTRLPDPAIWLTASVAPTRVAEALNGEIVDQGGNLRVLQTDRDPALHHSELRGFRTSEVGIGDRPISVVSKPRAYVESVRAPQRGEEVAANLRDTLGY